MAMYFKGRGYKEISEELFFGTRPAINKYRLARHAKYEVELQNEYGRPMEQAYYVYRDYFFFGFYQKAEGETHEDKWKEACERLNYAVGDGTGKDKSCFARCLRLMKELNSIMPDEDKMSEKEIISLIDWLTFDNVVREDKAGNVLYDPNYGFPLFKWFDEYNYTKFQAKLRKYILDNQQPSYKQIQDEVYDEYYINHPKTLIARYPYLG